MGVFFIEKKYKTAEEFLTALRKSNPMWEEHRSYLPNWVFRGQSNAKWKLTSSVFRTENIALCNNAYKNLSDIIAHKTGLCLYDDIRDLIKKELKHHNLVIKERTQKVIWQILSERVLLNQFVKWSDDVGLNIEEPFDNDEIYELYYLLPYLEKEIRKIKNMSFTDCTSIFNESSCFELFSMDNKNLIPIALAQHHGIPTRLLDWTKDPLIAAFFAASDKKALKAEQGIVIWALDTGWCSEYCVRVLDKFPKNRLHFLFAQKGIFTYMEKASVFYIQNGYWPSFVDYFSKLPDKVEIQGNRSLKKLINSSLKSMLVKMTLPVEETHKLLQLLDNENITLHTLCPTFNHVASSVKHHNNCVKCSYCGDDDVESFV